MNGINIKELCKQIRFDGKYGAVIWSREEKQHFISNRHYVVRFDELPREVTIALFSVFCKLPEVGETFSAAHGDVNDQTKPISYNTIYQPDKQDVGGSKTAYLRDMGNKRFAYVIKFPNHFSLVDEKYVKFAEDAVVIKTTGNSPHAPVYLADNNLMLLPIRVQSDSNFIGELITAEGDPTADNRP